MICAVVNNNLVVNVIVIEEAEQSRRQALGEILISITQNPGSPGIGWSYQDGVFTAPSPEDA